MFKLKLLDINRVQRISKEMCVINNEINVPIKDGNTEYEIVKKWLSNNSMDELYTDPELKLKLKQDIEAEAGVRILAMYPLWRQINHMAAVLDIQNKELSALKSNKTHSLSSDDVAAIKAAQLAKNDVFAIRSKSNKLAASIDAMTHEELKAFNPAKDSNWL